MNVAHFTFHDRLNFFLPRHLKYNTIAHPFDWRGSVKDMIESIGPPHPEVELILIDGISVGFDYIVHPDDVIDVYPDFDAVTVPDKVRLIPPYPGRPRFILDTHLGKLAGYLRMMGYDTLYRNDYPDDELAAVSNAENRILLTRDTGLLKRSPVIYGYFVRNTSPRLRLIEISQRYNLVDEMQPFHYCMKCNGLLEPVAKNSIQNQLQAGIAEHYEVFHRCADCEQIYWQGSHYERMQRLIDDVVNSQDI